GRHGDALFTTAADERIAAIPGRGRISYVTDGDGVPVGAAADPAARAYAATATGLDGGLMPLILPAGPDQGMILRRLPDDPAGIEQLRAGFAGAVERSRTIWFPRPPPAAAPGRIVKPHAVPDVPNTCRCGRPAGHVVDACLNGTPADIDREL